MAAGHDAHVTSDEAYVLTGYVAGYLWKPPERGRAAYLPTAVVTVSDCLTDFLPTDQDALVAPWHPDFPDATRASTAASAGTVRVLSMSVPVSAAPGLAAMIEGWIGDDPHPIRRNLASPVPARPGRIRGFEVLGFEAGRFHSWLCYDLLGDAVDTLGIHPNEQGLLTTLPEARQIANRANGNRGTPDGTPEDVTWFPALIIEYETGPR